MNDFAERLTHRTADYGRAVREAACVLRENSVTQPPVLPKELAEAYGIVVKFVRLPPNRRDVMGWMDFKSFTIFVNLDDAPNRQTFTIAHELGHYRLHAEEIEREPKTYKVLLRRPMGAAKDPLEQEANAFAANLLVPKDFLLPFANIASVYELSRLFIVSEEVIRYRLNALGQW